MTSSITENNNIIKKYFKGSLSQASGNITLVKYNPSNPVKDNVGIICQNGYPRYGFCMDYDMQYSETTFPVHSTYYLSNRWRVSKQPQNDIRLGICQRCVNIFTNS